MYAPRTPSTKCLTFRVRPGGHNRIRGSSKKWTWQCHISMVSIPMICWFVQVEWVSEKETTVQIQPKTLSGVFAQCPVTCALTTHLRCLLLSSMARPSTVYTPLSCCGFQFNTSAMADVGLTFPCLCNTLFLSSLNSLLDSMKYCCSWTLKLSLSIFYPVYDRYPSHVTINDVTIH